jgi:hypothetical protein
MLAWKRIHQMGTEAVLRPNAYGWAIQIDLREKDRNLGTIGGQQPTLDLAKALADKEIAKYHVCTEECQDWVEIRQKNPGES